MDYDKNDSQSQGYHLGSEDITKSPPLRSLPLPKFDLDEQLQVHLQYDSLGDTGALLGVQNQEENNWIEYFSQGGGIEFGSNIAASCSFSRSNNVWSEATSSESVEMLLKSVGQDVSIAKQNIIEESNVCVGLDSLNKQMDPTSNQDDSVFSMIRGAIDTEPTLPPERCPQRPLTLSKCSVEDHPYVGDVPLTYKDDASGLIDSDLSSVDNKFDSYVNVASERCSSVPVTTPSCAEKLSLEDHSSAAGKVAGENLVSVAFESTQVGPSSTSIQTVVVDAADGTSDVIQWEKPEGLVKDISKKGRSQILRQDAHRDDRHCAGNAMENCTDNLDNLHSSMLKPGSLVQKSVSDDAVFSEKLRECLKTDTHRVGSGVLSKNSGMGDQTAGLMPQEASSVAIEGDKDGGNLDSITSESMHVGPSATSVQNLVSGATDVCSEVVSHDKPEDLMGDISQKGKSQILKQSTQTDGRHCAEHAVKSGSDNLENFCGSVVKPSSLVKIAVSHDNVSSEKLGELFKTDTHRMDCRSLSQDNELDDQPAGSVPQEPSSIAIEDDVNRQNLDRVSFESVQVGPSATFMQDLAVSAAVGCCEVVSCDSPEGLMEGVFQDGHILILGQDNQTKDRNCVGHATESGTDNLHKPSSVTTAGDEDGGDLDRVDFESMQVDPSVKYMQDLVVGATDECSEVVSCDNPEGLTEGVSQKRNCHILRQDTQTDDRHVGHAAESGTDNLGDFPSSTLKPCSSVLIRVSCKAVVHEKLGELFYTGADQLDCRIFSKGSVMSDQVVGSLPQEASSVVTESDKGHEGHYIEEGNNFMVNPSTPIVKMDPPAQMKGLSNLACYKKPEDLLNNDGYQIGSGFYNEGSESDVQIRDRNLGMSSSVLEEKIEGELVENSMNDAGDLSSSVEMVCSPKDTFREKQEIAEIKASINCFEVEGVNAISHNANLEIMEKQMLDKVVENDGNKQNVNSNGSGVHNSIGGISSELPTSSFQDANLSQTCDNRSVDVASGDDHMVNLDGPFLVKENTQSPTHLDDMGKETGSCLVTDNRGDASSRGQSTYSVNAEVFESSAQHGNVYESEGILTATTTKSTVEENSTDIRPASIDFKAIQECVPSEVISQDATQLASFKKLDQTSLVADEVVDEKDGKLTLTVSNSIHLDKDETVDAISTQLCSSIQENCVSHASNGSIPISESRQPTVCNSAAEIVAEKTSHSTAAGNSLDISKASICIKAAWEFGKELKPQPDACSSMTNQSSPEVPGVSFDKCAAALVVTTETLPSSLDESSDDIVPNNDQLREANLVSGDDSSAHISFASRGGLRNICKESSLAPITLSDNIAEPHTHTDECGNPNSSEPNCGSPTVITCSEPSQTEKKDHGCIEKGSLDQNIPISDDVHQVESKVNSFNFPAQAPKGKAASGEDRSFTFKVGSPDVLPERESGKGWKKFSNIQDIELPQTAKESPTVPGPCQTDPEIFPETPYGRHQISGDLKAYGTGKGIGVDKTGLVSGSAANRTVSTGRKRAKETPRPKRTNESDGSPCSASLNSDGTMSRPTHAEGITKCSRIEGKNTKASCVPTIQASSLPDLNTSAAPMMLHQPFTILQQRQLRAQIFVYGSLIQGTAPDESCMISAFGDTSRDSGRRVWENVWRVAVERFKNQKSPHNNLKTPLPSYSGARVSRCSSLQSVALSSSASRSASKGAASAIVNPSLSLSSPVRSFSTPRDGLPSSSSKSGSSLLDSHQLLSTLHPQPTLHMSPWQSQAPGLGSWVVSPQTSALDNITRYSALPIAEAVKVTSVRDLSEPSASRAQLVSPSPLAPTVGPADVPTSANLLIEDKRKTPRKHASADQKPKKGKNSLLPELRQISSITQPQNEPASSTGATKHSATSGCILSPSPPTSAGTSCGLASTGSPVASSMKYHLVGSSSTDQRVIVSVETCSRIEQAKHVSADHKPKKRKTSLVPEHGQNSSINPLQNESASGVAKHFPTSECILSPSPPTSAGTSCGLASTGSPVASSMKYHLVGSSSTDQRVIVSVETCSRIEQAKHVSADHKPKKRKTSLVPEHGQNSSINPLQNESASGVAKHFPTSECILSPSPPTSAGTPGGLASTSSPLAPSMHYHIVGSGNSDQRVIFSEETCSRIEQAKLHAEDAAALADTAVRHSQGIWNQLAVKKNSGLLSEVEARLASAAVAAAVAASVAKAAAAAAKVASDAALQAKLIADEALIMPKLGTCAQDTVVGLLDGREKLERISSASIMKGKDGTESSSSLFVVAREAARRGVEVTSAAAKRLKNMDAVVKAAELAAEAVSHAGTVITMGDPIPLTLTELVEAGPEGYWKAHQNSAMHPVNANGLHASEQLSPVAAGECPDNTVEHLKELPSSRNETLRTAGEGEMNSTKSNLLKDSVESEIELVSSLQEGFQGQGGQNVSGVAKTVGEVSEMVVGLRAPLVTTQNDKDERNQPFRTSKEIEIKEGSPVEVVSDEDGLRGVWFSAKVLSLKDGKAYVCYTDLLQDEGCGQLKEWIPLGTEGNKAPRIRIAHPMTAMKFEGTRKRRREAMGNYVWSVGDRVDAWMRDGWWEGIVTERNKSDETKLTIYFPADGDSSIIRAWNLRPSLLWKDGQWMEWSRENYCSPHEVDTPEEKRRKLGRHEIEIDSQVDAGGNKQSKIPCIGDSREYQESRSLLNKKFTDTRNAIEENISDSLKMKRTGLQKEGSRVVFGIPKPGKKRKFMNVSKHYIEDGVAKTSEGTDSVKFAKYLVPQGSLGWKNTSKVNIKEKRRPTDSKPKMLYSGKDPRIPSRSKREQDSSSISVVSASSGSTQQDTLLNVKASVGHKENYLEKSTHLGVHSFSNTVKAAEDPVFFSPQELDSGVQSFKKPSSSDKEVGGMKGKAAVAGRKLASDVEKGSSIPGKQVQDATEPRRSNRRIQPTSRLLEGLQSSFIISKIPSLSHGKGAKTQHRSTSSSRGT
eukprot:TRINITY_DN858_c0_g5_i3.p1 TRINITY_DN858_c0_g5~~TRINITY_DN858_c0_g5_i3.p1  ORF type:complete len:2953 (+),score=716.13 TRINITY_DN858_c0_g5_i3:281-9139(+)